MKTVSVIVVNWNGGKMLADCLTSIYKQNYKKIEVIVVDNASEDFSVTMIRTLFPQTRLLINRKNVGFANGCNQALQIAKGEYILLFNNDAAADCDTVERLVGMLESDPSLGVAQPKIIYKDSSEYNDNSINSVGAFLTPTGFLYYPGYGRNDNGLYNEEMLIFSAYGACMLIKRELIDAIGLFDTEFFMYFEETDFCSRVWLNGKKVVYTPSTTVYHKGGVSARKIGSDLMRYHSFKNRINSYLKNLSIRYLLPLIFIHLFICESASLIYLLTGKFTSFIAIQKALIWNATHLFRTLNKRTQIQREIRRVKDVDYFPLIMSKPEMKYYLYLFKGLKYYKD